MSARQIHWLAPTTVLLALGAGVLFALGHHLFYSSLHGHAVHHQDISLLGSEVSTQQINITAGTVFAFLVNFSLETALATAYTQLVFRKLMYRKATLETWDATYGALSNIFYLGKVRVWWQLPLLCCVVLVSWLLPLASTITPGTLSVGVAPVNSPPVLQAHVPNVDFVSLNYVADMVRPPQEEDSRFNTRFEYEGPSPDVVRIANSVAQTGSILQINSPYPNATWTLEFEGPAISCAEVPESMQTDVRNRLKNTLFTPDTGCFVQGYMAWNDTDTGYPLPKNTSLSFSKLNKGGLALNVIGLPHMMDLVPGAVGGSGVIPYLEACYGSNGITHERFVDSTMIQCQLRNVTYQVLFEYQNGKQNISITTDTISEDPIRAISFVAGNGQTFPDNVINGVDCSVLSGVYDVDPGANPDNICLIDTKVLKTLSYQAIFQAFQELVIGSVTRASAATSANISTDVVNTILADTPNLAYLNPTLQSYSSLSTKPLQEYVQSGNVHLYKGLVNNAHTKSFDTLIPTMEKLFQDITVSMMSSRVLQPNLTSAFAPAPVQITLHNVHDVYVYSAARLWLAYGIAIFFAVMASVIGLRALFATGASYSQDFSTVLRIGRGALMSTEVKDGDTDGKDKLPKYLEEAQVWLRPANALAPTSKAEGVRSSDDISPNTQERVVGEGNRDL